MEIQAGKRVIISHNFIYILHSLNCQRVSLNLNCMNGELKVCMWVKESLNLKGLKEKISKSLRKSTNCKQIIKVIQIKLQVSELFFDFNCSRYFQNRLFDLSVSRKPNLRVNELESEFH